MPVGQLQGPDRDSVLARVESLNSELSLTTDQLTRELNKEKRRIQEEHDIWAPLILDARERLSNNEATEEEVESLEREENEAQLKIRREFKQRISDLTEKKKGIEEEVAKLQVRLSASKMLDEDCLRVIFEIFVDFGGSPWRLAHTCSTWRTVVLSTTNLWSGICISTNIDQEVTRRYDGKELCNTLPRLERALRRLGDSAIDLAIMLNWSHTSQSLQVTKELIVKMAEYSKQWRTLHIENSEKVLEGSSQISFPPSLFSTGLPSLVSASFHMDNFNSSNPSTGLLPFEPLVQLMASTSNHLKYINFHGYGHNDLTNAAYREPESINDLSILLTNPQDLKEAFTQYLQYRPAVTRLALRYAAFVLSTDTAPTIDTGDALLGMISTSRRLTLHSSILSALSAPSHRNIKVLDIIASEGLKLSALLHLPSIWQLSIYSTDLDGLHYLNAPNLDNLKVALINYDQDRAAIQRSNDALQMFWNRRKPNPKNVRFLDVGVDYMLLSAISVRSLRLESILFKDVTFLGTGALLGLAEKPNGQEKSKLADIRVEFSELLGPGRFSEIRENLDRVVEEKRLQQSASAEKKSILRRVTIIHADEDEIIWRATDEET